MGAKDGPQAGEMVRLGSASDSEESARSTFVVDGMVVETDGSLALGGLAEDDGALVVMKPGFMVVNDLAECVKKLTGANLDRSVLKGIVASFGRVGLSPCVQEWFQSILSGHMVDSFVELHPRAQERFTYWDQSKCHRYDNIGSRI